MAGADTRQQEGPPRIKWPGTSILQGKIICQARGNLCGPWLHLPPDSTAEPVLTRAPGSPQWLLTCRRAFTMKKSAVISVASMVEEVASLPGGSLPSVSPRKQLFWCSYRVTSPQRT